MLVPISFSFRGKLCNLRTLSFELHLQTENSLLVVFYNSLLVLVELATPRLYLVVGLMLHQLSLLLQLPDIVVLLAVEFVQPLRFLALSVQLPVQLVDLDLQSQHLHFGFM